MKIAFRGKDGLCPYFINNKDKYFIQDEKVDGVWKYKLMYVSLETKERVYDNFDTAETFTEAMLKGKQYEKFYSDSYKKTVGYKTKTKFYIIKNNNLTIRMVPINLSSLFDSYRECLEFSKDYVRKQLGEQLSFFKGSNK
ncbi:hypothetical protein [Abyssisolibacter fermentans]|uniref:hypothetical protein n=1 Tax=Abyssisolibacter fermentans TaxID=1766203 RepID=UPI00082C21E3|nr:hypothetical protein [Abyssisolibacter fermentans]